MNTQTGETIMSTNFKLSIIENFVRTMHQGQVRRNREEYVNHPLRVANELCSKGHHQAAVVAMLHDVVEDCGELHNLTTEELYILCDQFLETDEQKEALRLVTKLEGESSEDNLKRIALSGNKIAVLVKLYDAMDNMHFEISDYAFTREILNKNAFDEIKRYERISDNMYNELRYIDIMEDPTIKAVVLMDYTNSGYLNDRYVIHKSEFNDIRKEAGNLWSYYSIATKSDLQHQTYNYETGEYDYDTYYLTAIIDDNYDWWSMEYESIVNYLNSQEDLISTTIESVYGNQIETIGNGFNSTFVSLEEDDLPF